MIKTKSIYDPVEPHDGKRIFISSYRPKLREVVADLWFPELGSELELVKNWQGKRFDWHHFSAFYLEKIKQPEMQHLLEEIAEVARQGNVTLIGHARQSSQCHRTYLK